MGKPQGEDDDEPMPTPEQAQAYAEYAQAVVAIARLSRYCGGLTASQMKSHPSQNGCIEIPALGNSMLVAKCRDEVVIAVPKIHANWIEHYPFSCVVATSTDLFFVSKGFKLLGTEIPPLGVSLGSLIPSELLAELCRQTKVNFYVVDDISNAEGGAMLRESRPVPFFVEKPGVGVLQTREKYEAEAVVGRTDTHAILTSHFLG